MSKPSLNMAKKQKNKIPPHIKKGPKAGQKIVYLILEGDEEEYYFNRLKGIGVFSPKYYIRPKNVKGAGNIPEHYRDRLTSRKDDIVLIVCDVDRKPKEFKKVVAGVEEVVGQHRTKQVITFSRPCIMQIILLHFEEIWLKSPGTATYKDDVNRLTGVENYDKHWYQCEEICDQIIHRNWIPFIERLDKLSTDINDMPSSNIAMLYKNLSSDDISWIDKINKLADAEEADA